ncbi:LysM peptidoglycan-binding domain-containing protein [Pseudarthrobacter sp. NamE5]|uniref:LysM peptidoglycan-binding domain-containing protein n=1 Tax=Pseudarthrobacter sp. NamE5 TaxID=2576839 RepID=UPI00110A88B0|nr:LysM peptidoglycan-binding domain-containing protein [Pseudarthrobacter sp. NamE5]TLM85978.1 LysM peptidoglycan-binding domain-containing protein [Pseudarthrobacter sp. NamE5]
MTVVLSVGLAGCAYAEAPPTPAAAKPAAASGTSAAAANSSLAGDTIVDSFGNADFYTTVAGDTPAAVAAAFGLSEAKLNGFNGLEPKAAPATGTKLRLLPAAGPVAGAQGAATFDAKGIPTTYVIERGDTLGGITYRFGITEEQLAEANKVPYVYEKGNTYFIRSGHLIQLQKNPVDSRAGTGRTVNNSFGQAITYTTVDGDSFDSLGYKFRSTTEQILLYNPALAAGTPIPAGSKVRLIPGELKIEGAQGSFTADADGVPLTYTTAPGDTERQVSFRFSVTDLRAANRPLTGTGGTWYAFADLPTGELAPGQTISLALDQPINKPGL